MLINVMFMRNGEPCGREYAYKTVLDVKIGDIVFISNSKKVVVTGLNVEDKGYNYIPIFGLLILCPDCSNELVKLENFKIVYVKNVNNLCKKCEEMVFVDENYC